MIVDAYHMCGSYDLELGNYYKKSKNILFLGGIFTAIRELFNKHVNRMLNIL